MSDEERAASREKFMMREVNELGPLRQRITELEVENREIKISISQLMLERRIPPDEGAYQAKIKNLEEEITRLLNKIGE